MNLRCIYTSLLLALLLANGFGLTSVPLDGSLKFHLVDKTLEFDRNLNIARPVNVRR